MPGNYSTSAIRLLKELLFLYQIKLVLKRKGAIQ